MAEKETWPESLSDTYHRARRNLVLFSSILLSWEFLGVKSGDTVKAPLVDASVSIANPENLPVLIFVLVIFFTFRYYIEWFQCHPNRRTHFAARLDLFATNMISFTSIILYAYQTFSGVDLFEDTTVQITLNSIIALAVLSISTTFLGKEIASSISHYLDYFEIKYPDNIRTVMFFIILLGCALLLSPSYMPNRFITHSINDVIILAGGISTGTASYLIIFRIILKE